MGIIKAAAHAVGTGLADQWLEALEPDNMGAQTVFTKGVQIRKGKGENGKGSDNMVTEGSIIHVYPDQFMLLVDGGKVVDYTAEPGYYKVSLDTQPSLMNGTLGKAVKESLGRIRFGGIAPTAQRVYYINLQEIRGLKFGTKNAINYFDSFYNAELFLRAHGTYSIKITDPLKFYAEVVPKNAERLEMEDINEQYLNEFLEALQTSINQMSADGIRISYVPSKSMELGKYMANVLDEQWKELRGMEIQSVGIASISYDETSQEQQRRYDGRSFRKRRLCTKYHCRRSERRRNQFKWCHGRIYGNGIWHAEQRCVYGSRFRNQYAADADEPADAAGTADAIWNRKWRLPGRTDGLWSSKCRRPGSPAGADCKSAVDLSCLPCGKHRKILQRVWKTKAFRRVDLSKLRYC